MHMTVLDPERWTMKDTETPFSYWASLTPMAPFLGVQWRFAPDLLLADQTDAAPHPKEPRVKAAKPAPKPPTRAKREAAKVPDQLAAAPNTTKSATPPPTDDLTKIKGIGPKLAAELAAAGITQFAQIACWTERDIDLFEAKTGAMPGRISRDNWVKQAKTFSKAT